MVELYTKHAGKEIKSALLANVVLALGCLSMNKLYVPRIHLWRQAATGLEAILKMGLPALDEVVSNPPPGVAVDSAHVHSTWSAVANVLQAFFLIPPQPVYDLQQEVDEFHDPIGPSQDLQIEQSLLKCLSQNVLAFCGTCPPAQVQQLVHIVAGGILR